MSMLNAAARLSRSTLMRRSAIAFASRAIGTALSFTSAIMMARVLGTTQYGIYVFWWTAAGVTAVFVTLGAPAVVTNQIAIARGKNTASETARVLKYAYRSTAFATMFLICIAFGISFLYLRARWPDLLADPSFIAFLGASIACWPQIFGSVLFGFERILTAQLLMLIAPMLTTVGALILWFLAPGSITAAQGLWATFLATTLATFFALLALRTSITPIPVLGNVRIRPELERWLKMGVLFAINQFLSNSITQVDILMVGFLSTVSETAHYQAASRISYATAFFFGSITTVVAPSFSRIYAAGIKNDLSNSVRRASLLAFLGTLAIAIAVLIFGNTLLFLFGKDFMSANRVMYILMATWVVHSFFGLNNTLLNMSGSLRTTTVTLAAATVINIVFNALFVPRWGAEGAAWAGVISTLSFTLVFWAIVVRRHGFSADALSSAISLLSSDYRR